MLYLLTVLQNKLHYRPIMHRFNLSLNNNRIKKLILLCFLYVFFIYNNIKQMVKIKSKKDSHD